MPQRRFAAVAQLLSLRRGDIDAAFNLLPEQIVTLKNDKEVWLREENSLDFVYMALTQEGEFNKALAIKEARQAIGAVGRLVRGHRAAHPEPAGQVEARLGPREDPRDRAQRRHGGPRAVAALRGIVREFC